MRVCVVKSTRIAARVATIALPLCLAAACVSVSGGQYPTLAPGWHLHSDLRVGYAIALPSAWSAFDSGHLDDMVRACSSAEQGQRRSSWIAELAQRGAVLIACDTARAADAHVPIAYVIRSQAPPEGLDDYVASATQGAGRTIIRQQHLKVNAGDMIVQHVHERLTLPDGTADDILQYQYMVIRYGELHLLLIEFPTDLQDVIGSDIDRIGTSFTPTP